MSLKDWFTGGSSADALPAPVRAEPPVVAAQSSGTKAPEPWLQNIGFSGGSRVKTLPPVTPVSAERHATVFACCNNIAGDHAKVPLHVWQRNADGSKTRVFDHPASYLLNVEASPGVPGVVARFALVYAFALRGVCYGYAPRDGGGELELIDTISPDFCNVQRQGRDRIYIFQDGAEVQRRVLSRSMIHLRYGAMDGWTHRSPLQVAGESIGLALAGQEAAARTASGTTVKAVIEMRDDYETDEARKRSAAIVKQSLSDPTNDQFAVLNEGEKVHQLDLSAADQELLGSRKFDREMIAAVYRMPPSKLQMLENGVKANGQQQAIDYMTDCLLHWSRLIEPGYGQCLLTADERETGLFFQHDFSALLETTTKELFDAVKVAVGGPWMSPNTAQRMTDQPITEGGEKLYPPSNMTREDGAAKKKEEAET